MKVDFLFKDNHGLIYRIMDIFLSEKYPILHEKQLHS
jgi:hypothetical protein